MLTVARRILGTDHTAAIFQSHHFRYQIREKIADSMMHGFAGCFLIVTLQNVLAHTDIQTHTPIIVREKAKK